MLWYNMGLVGMGYPSGHPMSFRPLGHMSRVTFVKLHAERTPIDPHMKLVIIEISRCSNC